MRIFHFIGTSLAVILFGFTSLGSSPAWGLDLDFLKKDDQSVCYEVFEGDDFQNQIIRLNIKKHSPLTTYKEKKVHGHPIQTTYSAIGKTVEAASLQFFMSSTEGSVVVAKRKGARMGLTMRDLLNSPPQKTTLLECGDKESSATPETWEKCTEMELRVAVGNHLLRNLNLKRVNPLKQPLCSSFSALGPENDG